MEKKDKNDLSSQVNTLERALGERMLHHGLVILRQWVAELGMAVYADRIDQLEQNYQRLFDYYLTMDDINRDRLLDEMTGEAYRLEDDIYAEMRIRRGLSPEMHGFNGSNPQSVMRYFSSCVQMQTEDFDWIRTQLQDKEHSTMALLAIAALSSNLRECFSEEAILLLIEAIGSENQVIVSQALGSVILLLAHYDVRIDYFPAIEDAFAATIDTDSSLALDTLCALIRSSKVNIRDLMAKGELNADDMPDTLREVLGIDENDDPKRKLASIESWMPDSEREYMAGLVSMFPDTWVYNIIVGEDPENLRRIQLTYLSIGKMDLLWDDLEVAEQWLANHLVEEQPTPIDYINYSPLLFCPWRPFDGVRELSSGTLDHEVGKGIFRPVPTETDNCWLTMVVPLEQVYLMEDQLLTINK